IRRHTGAQIHCRVPGHRNENHLRHQRVTRYHGAAEVPGASLLDGVSGVTGDSSGPAAGELFGGSAAGPFSATALGSGDHRVVCCFSAAGRLGSPELTVVAETGGAVAPVPSSAARE